MLGSLGAGAVLGTLLFLAVRRGRSADVIVAARVGHFDKRAQAEVIRALRSDTPTRFRGASGPVAARAD
jgi:hypothetical protein